MRQNPQIQWTKRRCQIGGICSTDRKLRRPGPMGGHEDGENGAICYLFRRLLTGKADQIWRMIEEEEEINLNIWENVERQFQMHFPAKTRPTMTKDNPRVRSEKKTKANRMPRVVQGANEEIKTFTDRC